MIKKLITAVLTLLVGVTVTMAQNTPPSGVGTQYAPNWYRGYVPTPLEWQIMWSNKLNYFPTGLPIALGGCGATTVEACAANLGVITASDSVVLTNKAIVAPRSSKTANYTILANESWRGYDNIGASGQVDFTLPAATTGLNYRITVAVAQTVRIIAPASVTIALGELVSAAAGNISSDSPFSTIYLEAISTTRWVAISSTGTWTVN